MCFLDLSMKHFCLIPPMLDEVLHSYSNLHPTLKNQQILKTFLWKIYLLKICYY